MLPFGASTAYRLISISNDLRMLAHGPALPPCWRTMHAIHKLSDEEFDEAQLRERRPAPESAAPAH
jgi:hypothetical protein